MACTICFVWCDEAPCIGRSETISYLPLPTGAAHVDELTGVAPPDEPPLFPPLPLLPPLEPHPAATASESATAATIMARPETLLMRSPPTADKKPSPEPNRR